MEIKEINVSKISLRKDDILVIYVEKHIKSRQIEDWYKQLKEIMPWKNDILVVHEGIKFGIIEKKYKDMWDIE